MHPQKFHFILIDDSKLDCFIGEKIIQSTGRSETIKTFMDAIEALDHIKAKGIDSFKTIILVDIQMPLMNGFEFIEAFEKSMPEEVRSNYIINLLSSSINESDMIKAKGFAAVNNFLSKPINKDKLLSVIDNL